MRYFFAEMSADELVASEKEFCDGAISVHHIPCAGKLKEEATNCCVELTNCPVSRNSISEDVIKWLLRLNSFDHSVICDISSITRLSLENKQLEGLPENIDILIKLQHLNLSDNKLHSLPKPVGNLQNLCVLNLTNNSLVKLPDCIFTLENLKMLYVSNNGLACIPDKISDFKKLELLDVSRNHLEHLPETIGSLFNLAHLVASVNKLSYLSESIMQLNRLESLNLSHNALMNVPECLFLGLQQLTLLDLSYNGIEDFKYPPKCKESLRILRLNHNNLRFMPDWIFKKLCNHLVELNISNNREMTDARRILYFEKDGRSLSCRSLKYLNVSNCSLTSAFFAFLHDLHSLEILHIGNDIHKKTFATTGGIYANGNNFWEIPLGCLTSNMRNLKELIVSGVSLASLPDDITLLSELEVLDMHSNSCAWLPDRFCDLKTLVKCRLSFNCLASLPVQFGKLTSLTELHLDGNKICTLPGSFSNLSNLKYLDLYDNQLTCIPVSIKSLHNLQFLDLERNMFCVLEELDKHPSDEIATKYSQLKSSLRMRGQGDLYVQDRLDGMKVDDTVGDYSTDQESSDSSVEDEQQEFREERLNIEEEKSEEERWDLDADSDGDFDPCTFIPALPLALETNILAVNPMTYSPNTFCPADAHYAPMTRNDSELPDVVLGQFDDVSCDGPPIGSPGPSSELFTHPTIAPRQCEITFGQFDDCMDNDTVL